MTYFFDNCLAPGLAGALRALDEDVVHLLTAYPANTPDDKWLPDVASKGQIIVSCDFRIYLKQRPMLVASKATCCFFFSKTYPQLGKWEQAWRMMRYWPEIKRTAERAEPGQFFHVHLKGTIEELVHK